MNATEYKVLQVRDGYSIKEAGRKSGEASSCAGTIESLKVGEARTTLAEQAFTRYLARRNEQGYTFDDVEAAKSFYLKGFLDAYARVASKRRQLARKRD